MPDISPLLPPALKPGDTIGLFCPAGPVRDLGRVDSGIRILKDRGFRVRIPKQIQVQTDPNVYLAASDSNRAGQLQTLWADKEVKAVMAVRGGYGCLRLAGSLDFAACKKNPQWLVGFSDITVLLAANFMESGLISLHGPVISSLAGSDTLSRERFFSLLRGEYTPYSSPEITVIRPGSGRGRIVVGNLTTLVHLIGTPWEPDFAGAILMLEDTGESMYRIDRLLTHLSCSGRLKNLAGLITGTFDTGSGYDESDLLLQEQVAQRAAELTQSSTYPVWSNFPIGHQSQNQAIPYGMAASMESHSVTLTLHPPD